AHRRAAALPRAQGAARRLRTPLPDQARDQRPLLRHPQDDPPAWLGCPASDRPLLARRPGRVLLLSSTLSHFSAFAEASLPGAIEGMDTPPTPPQGGTHAQSTPPGPSVLIPGAAPGLPASTRPEGPRRAPPDRPQPSTTPRARPHRLRAPLPGSDAA